MFLSATGVHPASSAGQAFAGTCAGPPEPAMRDRFTRIAVLVLIALLAIIAAQPYLDRLLLSTPRPVEARGNLADSERTAIDIFARVAPSVVQVAGARSSDSGIEQAQSGVPTGTGFVWDAAGHVVTNNHVVEGAQQLRVRRSTEQVLPAQAIGPAPNYDPAGRPCPVDSR